MQQSVLRLLTMLVPFRMFDGVVDLGYGCGEPSQLLQLLRTSIRHRSSSGRVACGVSTRGALGLLSRVRNVGEVRRSG